MGKRGGKDLGGVTACTEAGVTGGAGAAGVEGATSPDGVDVGDLASDVEPAGFGLRDSWIMYVRGFLPSGGVAAVSLSPLAGWPRANGGGESVSGRLIAGSPEDGSISGEVDVTKSSSYATVLASSSLSMPGDSSALA